MRRPARPCPPPASPGPDRPSPARPGYHRSRRPPRPRRGAGTPPPAPPSPRRGGPAPPARDPVSPRGATDPVSRSRARTGPPPGRRTRDAARRRASPAGHRRSAPARETARSTAGLSRGTPPRRTGPRTCWTRSGRRSPSPGDEVVHLIRAARPEQRVPLPGPVPVPPVRLGGALERRRSRRLPRGRPGDGGGEGDGAAGRVRPVRSCSGVGRPSPSTWTALRPSAPAAREPGVSAGQTSGLCITCRPTGPWRGWSKASGIVARTVNPREVHRRTAGLVSTTALKTMAR